MQSRLPLHTTTRSIRSSSPHQQSSPRTTVASLPTELIFHILNLVPPKKRTAWEQAQVGRIDTSKYPDLKSASLVCRYWTAPSTALLHQNIRLKFDQQARCLLDSQAFGLYRTTRLDCFGGDYGEGDCVTEGSLEEILSRVKGLRELELMNFDGLRFASLCSPNLAGITHMELRTVTLTFWEESDEGYAEELPVIPFALQDFHMDDYRSDCLLMFTCFNSNALRTLSIGGFVDNGITVNEEQIEDLCDFFRQTGPHVTSLSLNDFDSFVPEVEDVFSAFISLRDLLLFAPTADLIRAILRPLPARSLLSPSMVRTRT